MSHSLEQTCLRRPARHWEESRWDQRVGGFTSLPALLHELGADPDAVLASAGLAPDALATPEGRIAYGSFGKLLGCAAEATGYAHIGLLAGRLWHVDQLGVVGELVRNAATVGEALQVLTVHQQLNSGGGLAFCLRRATIVDVGYAIYYPGIAAADQIYDNALAIGFNLLRELAGAGWAPSEVFLPHDRPRDALLYRQFFKVMPHFNAEFCALRFPGWWLDRPVEGADPERKRAALLRARAATPDLLKQIYRGLRTLLLEGRSSGDDLAQMLSMHRRTLNRRLHDHGTTFQQVLDEVRFEVARQLLSYSELSLDDIAAALGYAGVSPFMRTFRRWSGMTPGQWRRHALEERAQQRADAHVTAPPSRPHVLPIVPPQGEWKSAREAVGYGP